MKKSYIKKDNRVGAVCSNCGIDDTHECYICDDNICLTCDYMTNAIDQDTGEEILVSTCKVCAKKPNKSLKVK